MAKETVHTGQEGFAGEKHEYGADGSCVYDGVPGYPKGTPGKIKEVTFDDEGVFGKVPRADKGK